MDNRFENPILGQAPEESKKEKQMKKKPKKPARYFASPRMEGDITVVTPNLQTSHQKIRNFKDLQGKSKPRGEKFRDFKKWKNKHNKPRGQDGELKHWRKKTDPFPGDAPVSEEKLHRYNRGEQMTMMEGRTRFAKDKMEQKEKKIGLAVKQAARSELLLHEEAGFIEAEEGEDTTELSQHEIVDAVDITSAQKFFELTLDDFGPYRINYTRNGRFLLMGGAKGHVAAIDWLTKKLLCEMNVMETVNDVRWLHQETLFAVAQKQWTYIYDNQGVELHCLKMLDSVLRMEFLPYHFLLASSNSKGYLSYIDVSVGQKVAGHSTGLGRLGVMCHNPDNAIICLGHPTGTVTMWSPNVKEPLVKMLCHKAGVRAIAIDKKGQYMATSGIDRSMKIWDLRTYKQLKSYKLGGGAGHLTFSQRGLLAAGIGNVVEVYQECCRNTVTSPYMSHKLQSSIHSIQFCPYEDVLGVGHGGGFSSLIIPGAGEANFDALEANPYQTKKQRQQAEVKMLLEKIQPEMIHIDAGKIGQVDTRTFQERIEEKNKLLYVTPLKMEYEPRYKMKGKSKGKKKEQRKKGVVEEQKKEKIRETISENQKKERQSEQNKSRDFGSGSVLDRFKKKAQ